MMMILQHPTNKLIRLRGLVFEDFVNYKTPSLFLGFEHCDFKCNKDAGRIVCQNYELGTSPRLTFNFDNIIYQYINDPITHAIVFGGLEPFLSSSQMLLIAHGFRDNGVEDPIVVYTGYNQDELLPERNSTVQELISLHNIIIKYGRYIPDLPSLTEDKVLGVTLASANQFAILYE